MTKRSRDGFQRESEEASLPYTNSGRCQFCSRLLIAIHPGGGLISMRANDEIRRDLLRRDPAWMLRLVMSLGCDAALFVVVMNRCWRYLLGRPYITNGHRVSNWT